MTSHRFKKGVQYWKNRTDLKYTPASIEQSALEYFEWINENPLIEYRPMVAGGEIHMIEVPKPRPMTIKGFCLFSGIGQRYLNELAHHEDFRDVIEWIKEAIYTQKFEGAAVGLFNANLISCDLGLADKQEVQAVQTITEAEPSKISTQMMRDR